MSNNKGPGTNSITDLENLRLSEGALSGVVPGEISNLEVSEEITISDRVSNDVQPENARPTRKDSPSNRGTLVDTDSDKSKIEQSITDDEKKEIDNFANTLNEPVRLEAFISALSEDRRGNLVSLLLNSAARPSRIESHIIGEKEGPVRPAQEEKAEFRPIPVETAAVREEMVRILDEVPAEKDKEENEELLRQEEIADATREKIWKNKKIREKIDILANNESIRLAETLEAEKRDQRVKNYALFRAAKWVAEPVKAVYREATGTPSKFKFTEWLKKPVQKLINQPAAAVGNFVARTLSKPLAKYDEQVKLVERKMEEIKAEHHKLSKIEDLGYEAVADYAKELGEDLSLHADKDYLGAFVGECLDNPQSPHYARVQQIINQRKTRITDESDEKLAEWFEYDIGKTGNIGVVEEMKQEALEKSRLMRAREASRKALGFGKVTSFFKGLLSSNAQEIKEEIKEVPAQKAKVEPKFESTRPNWFSNRVKLGLAGLTAFGMAITAVDYAKHNSRNDDEKVSFAGNQAKNASKSPAAPKTEASKPVEVAPWIAPAPKPAESAISQTQNHEAAPAQPKKVDAPKVAIKSPIKAAPVAKAPKLAKVEPKPQILVNDNPYGEDDPAPQANSGKDKQDGQEKVDKDLLTLTEINDALAVASGEIEGISKRVKDLGEYKLPAGFKGLKEPSLKTNYNLNSVNDLLDQYLAKMKEIKTHKDIDEAKKILKDINKIVSEAELKKASDVFMAYQQADTPLIISTHNLMIQSRKALNGRSGKFEIQYNKQEINNEGSVVTRYQPVAVDLDSYEKEYDGYQDEITRAVLDQKPIAQARLEIIHARMTWLHQQMAFVSYYLNHSPAPDTIVFAEK